MRSILHKTSMHVRIRITTTVRRFYMEFRSTMDVELIDVMGNDVRVAKAAWVSTMTKPTEQEGDAKRVAGLINFLMRDRHGSPFESCVMQFRTTAPIFVWREHMRHRMASYNEQSGRYTKLEPVFYVPDRERNLIQTGQVGHYQFQPGTYEQHDEMNNIMKSSYRNIYDEYERMLNKGIAKEVARSVLPVSIYSTAYVTMNLRGLMNFLSLRNATADTTVPTHPQREIEMVAEQYEKYFEEKFPLVHASFVKNGRICP